MGAKLDPELRQRLQRDPGGPARLIVGVAGDLGQRAEELARRGLTVHRRLAVITALAVGCLGHQALALSAEPWVIWIEEDREVQAYAAKADRSR